MTELKYKDIKEKIMRASFEVQALKDSSYK